MTYSLKETEKGWMISVRENRKKIKYFLWDEGHTKEKYIHYVLTYGDYRIGQPFGNDIYPLYINHSAIKKINQASHPITVLSVSFKQSVIWRYYRSFLTEDSKPKLIKQYANELKSNLELLGLDGLYQYVRAQI